MSSADRYRDAGVDLDAAERVKQRIKAAVASTYTDVVRSAFGAFGGVVRLPEGVGRSALVMSTDGVGTKLLVAVRADRHDTVGEDLVNHCVNDILVHGAAPLAFLDYIAGSKVEDRVIAALVDGIARGCRNHGMPLVGGETAQLPDLYHPGHYDLAGTIVGIVSEDAALGPERVSVGDVLIAYASNGLHTNGYTLARRIVFDTLHLDVASEMPEVGATVGDILLAVHTSYRAPIAPALYRIHALAHVTGGGIPGNLSRSLPEGCGARIDRSTWSVPAVFRALQEAGRVDEAEMFRVFNMGVGMIAAAAPEHASMVCRIAERAGIAAWEIGEVVAGHGVEFVG